MPEFTIRTTATGVTAYSFTTGAVCFDKKFKIVTEEQALARAMWLERNQSTEEAVCFLDDWVNQKR